VKVINLSRLLKNALKLYLDVSIKTVKFPT